MARVRIELPPKFEFSTEFRVHITDVNAGGHLGNHSLVALLNEAYMRYLKAKGFPELMIDGCAFINADLAVVYKAEAFHGDVLMVEVAADDLHKYGCDIVYRVTNKGNDKEVAVAKTGMVFFDYSQRKVAETPERFKALFATDSPSP